MNLFAWIVFGLLAGGIAKFIMPGKDPGGCLITIVIGIIGALIGGVLGTRVLGVGPVTGFNLQSLGLSILGAILLLAVFRLVIARRPPR
ncbi:MAG: GlsB/YeaQ/YmgE family stress response membrane protein [Longimicrobiales bacterium]